MGRRAAEPPRAAGRRNSPRGLASESGAGRRARRRPAGAGPCGAGTLGPEAPGTREFAQLCSHGGHGVHMAPGDPALCVTRIQTLIRWRAVTTLPPCFRPLLLPFSSSFRPPDHWRRAPRTPRGRVRESGAACVNHFARGRVRGSVAGAASPSRRPPAQLLPASRRPRARCASSRGRAHPLRVTEPQSELARPRPPVFRRRAAEGAGPRRVASNHNPRTTPGLGCLVTGNVMVPNSSSLLTGNLTNRKGRCQ